MKRTLSLVLALLMLAPTVLTSCAESSNDETKTPTNDSTATPSGDNVVSTDDDNPYYEGYVDPFQNVSYGGKTFRVHNSINAATGTMQSSAYLIAGPEEYTGDAASDAAYDRNGTVADMLDIDLVFDGYDWVYGDVAANIRTLITSGDTSYDLIVNDIYGLAPIVTEGIFANANDGANFDFSNPWWYDQFMSDVSIHADLRYLLAGDFFVDLLRTAHVLFMNKDIYVDNQLGTSGNDVYQTVINGDWTLDEFKRLIEVCYRDTNGNGTADIADTYGFVAMDSWGPVCPFIISSDPGFIDRNEEGFPVITVNNERSALLVEKLLETYNNAANSVKLDESVSLNIFTEGRALFIGYQRLGTLENAQLRDSEIDLAVLPYPKLDENQQNYVTSAHDTSELGFIPVTVTSDELAFASAVIEVLCRETYAQVLPIYYEESLKIKYTRDEASAQMIDIIHDNFDNGFPLAYSNGLAGVFLKATFGDTVTDNVNTFASRCKSYSKVANKLLGDMIKACEALMK